MYDKYKKLALEALSIGDKVLAENYFQHADHFARILPQFEGPNNISNTNDKVSADSNSISPEDDSSEAQTSDTKRDLQDDSTVIARSSSES